MKLSTRYFGEQELLAALRKLKAHVDGIAFSDLTLPYIVDASYQDIEYGLVKALVSLNHHQNRYNPALKYEVGLSATLPKSRSDRLLAVGSEDQIKSQLEQFSREGLGALSFLPDFYRGALES